MQKYMWILLLGTIGSFAYADDIGLLKKQVTTAQAAAAQANKEVETAKAALTAKIADEKKATEAVTTTERSVKMREEEAQKIADEVTAKKKAKDETAAAAIQATIDANKAKEDATKAEVAYENAIVAKATARKEAEANPTDDAKKKAFADAADKATSSKKAFDEANTKADTATKTAADLTTKATGAAQQCATVETKRTEIDKAVTTAKTDAANAKNTLQNAKKLRETAETNVQAKEAAAVKANETGIQERVLLAVLARLEEVEKKPAGVTQGELKQVKDELAKEIGKKADANAVTQVLQSFAKETGEALSKQNGRIDTLEKNAANQEKRIAAVEKKDGEHEQRLSKLEAEVKSLSSWKSQIDLTLESLGKSFATTDKAQAEEMTNLLNRVKQLEGGKLSESERTQITVWMQRELKQVEAAKQQPKPATQPTTPVYRVYCNGQWYCASN